MIATDTDLIDEYRQAQRRRGLIESSSKKRGLSLLSLARAIAPRSLLEVTRADLENWLDTKGASPKSRNWHLTNVRCFFRWCVLEEHLEVDPSARIQPARLRRALPRPIATADLDRAIIAAEDPTLRCWLALAAYQGMRVAEIAHLRREDIIDVADPPTLVVTGKGDRQRALPLHPSALAVLRRRGLPQRGYLFEGQFAGHVTPNTVTRRVAKHLRSLGIDSTAHSLRHWFASEVYRASRDLRMTQELLGHASVATTQIYTAWDQTGAGAVVRQLAISPFPRPGHFS